MGKGRNRAKVDPLAKRAHETDLQWRSRIAREKQEARKAGQPLVTPEAARHGDYVDTLVLDPKGHGGKMAKVTINRVSRIVDKWLNEESVGFGPGARIAINHCHTLWERMPVIGKLTAIYDPPTSRAQIHHENISGIDAAKELARLARDIPPPYWRVFENVVRWGHPAGTAASGFFANDAQAIASAKTIVGFVASLIATRENY